MLACVREYDPGPVTARVNVGEADPVHEIPKFGEVQPRVTAMLFQAVEY